MGLILHHRSTGRTADRFYVVLFVMVVPPSTAPLTLFANQEAMVRGPDSYLADRSFECDLGLWWSGPVGPTHTVTAALLQFDVSGVNEPLLNATFHHFVYNHGDDATLHELLVPWNSSVTYNSLPWSNSSWGTAPVAAISGHAQSEWSDLDSGVWHTADVTSSVSAWLAGARANHGFIVLPGDGADSAHMQCTRSARPPRLELNLLVPPAAPPSLPPPPPSMPPPPPVPPVSPPTEEDDTLTIVVGFSAAAILLSAQVLVMWLNSLPGGGDPKRGLPAEFPSELISPDRQVVIANHQLMATQL